MYGNPEVTTGGRALKFYASVRMDVRRIETLKNGSEAYGSRTRVRVVKNKVSLPRFKEAEFDLIYGKGISREGEIVDVAVKLGVIQKSGAWFSYEGQRLGQGREKAKDMIISHPDLREEIEKRITDILHDSEAKTNKKPPKERKKPLPNFPGRNPPRLKKTLSASERKISTLTKSNRDDGKEREKLCRLSS